MAIAKECDICGALYKCYNEKNDKNHPNGYQLLNIDKYGKYYAGKSKDCCPDCMANILSFIDLLKKGEKVDEI